MEITALDPLRLAETLATLWQRIDTAPRDGTAIDIWVVETSTPYGGEPKTEAYRVTGCRWGEFYLDYSLGKAGEGWCYDADYYGETYPGALETSEPHDKVTATHWMPMLIPGPPT